MMRNAALILDFDGTILDTERSRFSTWADLWNDHGHQLTLLNWQQGIGTEGVFDPWAELEQLVGSPLDPSLRDLRRQRQNELQSEYGPRPGVLAWLEEARDLNVPVGIASSAPENWVRGNLDLLGIGSFFSCLVCVDEQVPAKPQPTSYRIACELLDADVSCSVAVEDSPHGIAAASAAGLFTVAVPHALTRDLDMSGANVVLSSLEDLSLTDALKGASSAASTR